MLLAGFALRNIPVVSEAIYIDYKWSSSLRSIALAIILTRAGLGLDAKVWTMYSTPPFSVLQCVLHLHLMCSTSPFNVIYNVLHLYLVFYNVFYTSFNVFYISIYHI